MWDDLRCFVSSVETGSFTETAKRLNLSVATVSRRLEKLESELGLRLLNRHITGVELTAEGKIIYGNLAGPAEHFFQVERIAATLRDGVNFEPVVISSTEPIISEILGPRLAKFLIGNADLRLTLSVSTANVSLSKREADIAIRLNRPEHDNLMAKRLPSLKQGLYASKTYLNGRDPRTLNFQNENFLGMDNSFGEIPEAAWFSKHGLGHRVVLKSSSVRTLCTATLGGCGISMVPKFIAESLGLIEIPSPVFPVPMRTPYMVFHRDLRKVKRIVLARNWIVECFELALGKD
jgi:DNA-binding transcriptional LysR family regulator